MTPLLLSLVASALCSGAILFALSFYMPRHREWHLSRVASVLAVAAALNLLAVPSLYTGLAALVVVPAACWMIGAVVAAICPSYGWLFGAIASPWFVLGGAAVRSVTSQSQESLASGAMLGIVATLAACGLVGGICGHCASYLVVIDENA